MSDWGRNYNSGGNHNYYYHNNSIYQQNGSAQSYENWPQYLSENGMQNQVQTRPYMFVHNPPGYLDPGPQTSTSYLHNTQASEVTAALNPYLSREMYNDLMVKAANSTLTPTAGEFIPSMTYEARNYVNPGTREGSTETSSSNYAGDRCQINDNSASFRSSQSQHVMQNSQQNRSYNWHSKQNWDKGKNNKSRNYVKHKHNLELLKAEGRKKLLAEAAGILSPSSTSANSTFRQDIDFPSSSDGTSWRGRSENQDDINAVQSKENKKPLHFDKRKEQQKASWNNSPPHDQKQHSSKKEESIQKNSLYRREKSYSVVKDSVTSQRDRLTEQLNRGSLECLVCCERVRQYEAVWSCANCFHVLHLRCTIKWAKTSRAENGWRCPACQNVTSAIPQNYVCFCGKTLDPEWNRSDIAHSCGKVCNRSKGNPSIYYECVHTCTLLCHPGPCPPCVALVTRKCGCGKTSQPVQCGQSQPLVCGAECGNLLNCGEHKCTQICHVGECGLCKVKVKQECYCGKENREVICDGETSKLLKYTCNSVCNKTLSCGYHTCTQQCHDGPCESCQLDPAVVTHCHCGKTELNPEQERKSCLDSIPTCDSVCGKKLKCGQPSSPHTCKCLCHEGPCPPCDLTTFVRCRCGFMDKEIPCAELTSKADDARCQKKCTKRRSCGKHKCNQMCCIDVDHICPLPCNHMLSCGQHRCEQLCHRGYCQPCWRTSFEELYCECGKSVLFPPVPCGTRPPECSEPCSRQHGCDHPVLHNCHSLPNCPPCSVLTAKYCHGKHELRKSVPCHIEEFSCGLPCGKPLNCGRHKCIQPCHKGECLKPGQICKQPCTKPRELCGHPCNNPCHGGDCVDTPCKETVIVTCECGNRSCSRPCFENNSEYQRIATSLLASKMADVQLGRSVQLNDMQSARKMNLKSLECNEECRIIERNRRLAIGLQIRNPDLSSKLTPRYSEFMRNWAKKDARFCEHVHNKLTELVQLAKQSKQKSRSYSFETMNREKRQFVHEYCEHFGCESVAYDAEPKRNVVATAQRDKAWLPSYSLLEVVQREMGQRKVPVPNINSVKKPISKPQKNVGMLPVRVALGQQSAAAVVAGKLGSNQNTTADTPQLPVDYFDMTNS